MEGLLVVASFALAIWGVLLAWRGSLLAGGTLFLFVAYFVGREVFRFELGPIPMTLERPVLAALLAMWVVQCLFGVARPFHLGLAEYAALALAGLLTVSTFRNNWGWENYAPVYRLVACFLMPIALYFVVRSVRITERTWGWFNFTMLLFGIYLSVTAIAEVTQQWWLVFPRYIADPRLGIHFGRARGASLQAQSLGLFVGLSGVCAWTWLGRFGGIGNLVRLLVMPLFGAAMFLTSTRCVWLGAALATFAILFLNFRRGWRVLLVGVTLLAGIALVSLKGTELMEIARGDQSQAAARDSVSHRKVYLYVSWLMFLDRPLLGCGAGQFVPESPSYLADHSIELNLDKIRGIPHHNTFLSLLVENGIVGCSLFCAMLFGWARTGWRLWHSDLPLWRRRQGLIQLATLGVYLPDALFFDPGSYAHQDHYFVFLIAGLTSAVGAVPSPVIAVMAVMPPQPAADSDAASSLGLTSA